MRRSRCRGIRRAGERSERAVHPDAGLSHRRLRAEWNSVRQWLRRLLQARERARRRRERRQDHLRGMRYRLRHRPRRRMLRASEGKGPTGVPTSSRCPPASPSRSPKKRRRQDPALFPWATAARNRATASVFQWNFPLLGTYWDGRRYPCAAHRKREGGSTSSRARRSRSSITTRPTARSRSRCCRSARRCTGSSCSCSGHASRRGAEGHLAADSPEPSGLRVALGLGRDELDRDQGSGRGRLSARQDVRRVVVGGRARRAPGRGRRQGLSPVTLQHTAGPVQAARRPQEICLRQGPGSAKWEETGESSTFAG